MSFADECRALLIAKLRLTGIQAVTLEDAWVALTGLPAKEMGPEQSERVQRVIEELGYRIMWVNNLDRYGGGRQYLWARQRWMFDNDFQDRRTLIAYQVLKPY